MRSDSDLPAFTTTATTTTKTKKKTFIKSASMFGRVEKGDLKKRNQRNPCREQNERAAHFRECVIFPRVVVMSRL